MKKVSVIFTAMILALLFSANTFGGEKDNFLLLRYEAGRNAETHDDFRKTFSVIENNSLERWAFGSKFATGEDGFMIIKPYACYKFGNGFQLGAEYAANSLGGKFIGPKFRFLRIIGKVFVFFDATQYFDTKDDGDITDIFLCLQTTGHGWYYGAELGYCNTKHGTEDFYLRPAKVGYKFKNDLRPFVMIQRYWKDEGDTTNSFFAGVEIIF